jgi:protocatechuate 3,4-dioxygenase beta subunit
MDQVSRRQFVAGAGLAVLGAGGLVLRADAQPTPESGEVAEYNRLLRAGGRPAPAAPAKLAPTEDCILGPFYRPGAPFRAKVTPPLEAGVVLVVAGRVWGFDTRKPLAGAALDVWQANARGRYDNDDPRNPPRKDVFVNRARLIADETGYYEFETVHPGAYKIGPDTWRPSHIHYAISHPGYKTLVTQLFFKGDPHNKTDAFIKESLIIELRTHKVRAASYEAGTFDVVLAAAPKK